MRPRSSRPGHRRAALDARATRLERARTQRADRAQHLRSRLRLGDQPIIRATYMVGAGAAVTYLLVSSRPDRSVAAVLIVVLWVVVIGGGVLSPRLRRSPPQDARALLAGDGRSPILYLRPFPLDGARVRRSWQSRTQMRPRGDNRDRYEEWLARRLRSIAPFITLGDPSEGVPQVGAARLYASDEGWREAVEKLLARAGTIILHVGDSPGLSWEVQRIVSRDEPERLLLSLPLGGWNDPGSRYDAFRARFGDMFPRGLPPRPNGTYFLYFDADWNAYPFGELGVLPPLPIPGLGEQRGLVLRNLAPEFKRLWAPRWARATVYLLLAASTAHGFADPRYLLLAGLGLLVVAAVATPGPSPIVVGTTTPRAFVDR